MTEDFKFKFDEWLRGEWKWWATDDGGEYFLLGPEDSREAIIDLVKKEGGGEYQNDKGEWRLQATISECCKDGTDLANYFDFELWIEEAADRMNDDERGSNEDGDYHPLSELTEPQLDDLEMSIKAAIRDWQWRNNLRLTGWCFTNSRNEENIDIPHPRDKENKV